MLFLTLVLPLVAFLSQQVIASELTSDVLVFPATLTSDQVEQVEGLREKYSLDFLTHAKAGEAFSVIVPASETEKVQQEVESITGEMATIVTEEALSSIKEEALENDKQRKAMKKFRNQVAAPTGYYAQLDEVYKWMDTLPRVHQNVKVENIGTTHEGRVMKVLKLNSGLGRPIIFVESGIHAREWLSPATAIYIFDRILNSAFAQVTDKYEFHFLLIANPDGYEHTHKNQHSIQGRFWRKNRRASQSYCVGTDLNRNFDVDFGRVGVAHHCGSDIFPGTHAFSEPETRNERDYILRIARQMKMFLSIHTFGQMVILPYAYTTSPPADLSRLQKIGQAAIDAFQKVGRKQYYMGNTQQLGLGLVSGSIVDWVKDVAKVPNSFAFELQPRGVDAFRGGFNPPVSSIRPSGEETVAAFVAMLSML